VLDELSRHRVAGEPVHADVWGARGFPDHLEAIEGLIVFLVVVIVYMALRLEARCPAPASSACSTTSPSRRASTPSSVRGHARDGVAILTILGYSLYDTVVVFDKIKRTSSCPPTSRSRYRQLANDAMTRPSCGRSTLAVDAAAGREPAFVEASSSAPNTARPGPGPFVGIASGPTRPSSWRRVAVDHEGEGARYAALAAAKARPPAPTEGGGKACGKASRQAGCEAKGRPAADVWGSPSQSLRQAG